MSYLEDIRDHDETADLAFMAYRDLSKSPWKPFLKAAVERNPVCIAGTHNHELSQVFEQLRSMEDASIYDGTRMAQPDEVWNYGRGDGLEKAICMITVIKERYPEETLGLKGNGRDVSVFREHGQEFRFKSTKNLSLPQDEDFDF